jgi:hypothetical protein
LNPRGQIHSLPPKPLGHGHMSAQADRVRCARSEIGARGTSRTCLSGFSDRRLDRNGLPGEIGGRGGNRTLICWLQASGPPVERLPQNWLRAGELNATRMAYEASMTPVHLPAEIWSGKLGSNQRPLDYRSSAQTTLSFSRSCYSRKEWSPVPDSSWLFRSTGPAHRRLCLQGLRFWSQWSESNAHRSPTMRLLSH